MSTVDATPLSSEPTVGVWQPDNGVENEGDWRARFTS